MSKIATIHPIPEQRRNRHPVDELGAVRAEIRRLQARETELREIVLSDGCTLDGHDFEAEVQRRTQRKLDTAAVRKAFGEVQLAPYLKPSEVVTVTVKPIDRSHLAEVEP